MRKLRIVLALAVFGALGYAGYGYWSRPHALPDAVIAAQRALATPDALALITVDVSSLVSRESSDGTGLLAEARRRLAASPLDLVDWERDARYLIAGLYSGPADSLVIATVVFGDFNVGEFGSALSSDKRFQAIDGRVGSERVWMVARSDPDSCEPPARWIVHATPQVVSITGPRAMGGYLRRMRKDSEDLHGLEAYQRLAFERMLSAVLFPRPDGPQHPVVDALRQDVEGVLGPIKGNILLGLDSTLFWGGLKLDLQLEAPAADSLAARWIQRRDEMGADWSRVAPTLAELHEELEIEGLGSSLRAEARLPGDALASAFRIPDELLVLASRSEAWLKSSGHGKAPDSPARRFLPKYPVSSLPRYDRKHMLAGPGDLVAGPFGLHVRAVRRSVGSRIGLEFEVEADAPALANLGESSPRPRLDITEVLGTDGRELLVAEDCGPDRNGRPAEMELISSGQWMRARKTVRIDPAVSLDAVASLSGYVELALPVRIAAERLPPKVGATVERDGVRVEITGVSDGFFSYRVSGEHERALEIRGLGNLSRPLPVRASWTQSLYFDAGRVGMRSLGGKLEEIEVIFSADVSTPKWPFRFDSVRPGSNREEYASQSVRFVEYSLAQYTREYRRRFGRPFRTHPRPRARTTAGPFTISLRGKREKGRGLIHRLEVLSPDIPNLSYSLSALELEWNKQRVPLRPRYRFGHHTLISEVDLGTLPEEIQRLGRLEGQLVLRLAHGVEALRLDVLEPGRWVESRGVRLEVTELGRDRLTTRIVGDAERLVIIAALNKDGRALRVEPLEATRSRSDSALYRTFRVFGKPTQLQVGVAGSLERMDYPFQLDWAAPVPAAPAAR